MTDTTKSTFKVGDRVRHRKFGGGVVVNATDADDPGMIPVRFDGWDEYEDATDYHPMRESGIWHDPPPDTRKRLREYTDLADGDVVVIAGVPMTVHLEHGPSTLMSSSNMHVLIEAVVDMLVDEVRRKPRTKKRRVYEEVVDPTEVRVGDIHCFDGAENFVRRDEDLKVMSCAITRTVFRLVEETEVPR